MDEPPLEFTEMTADDVMNDHRYRLLGYDKLLQKLRKDLIKVDDVARLKMLVQNDPFNQQAKRPRSVKVGLRITAPPGSWQIDIIDLPRKRLSRGDTNFKSFLLLVEIPSRFAWAKPISGKSDRQILMAYKEFVIETLGNGSDPLISVWGDEAFNSLEFRAYNSVIDVQVYTNTAKHDHITKYGSF